MATLAVTNTFVDGTTAVASEVNANFADIVNYINNRNDASATWDALRATTSSAVVAILNNSTGANDILRAQDNGTNVFVVGDGGATVATATAGGSSVALTANNNTSTGAIFIAQDNGSAITTIADGGTLTHDGPAVFNEAGADKDFRIEGNGDTNSFFSDASSDAIGMGTATPGAKLQVNSVTGTMKALIANNSTSTGNIFEAQDNGTAKLTVADGGTVTVDGPLAINAATTIGASSQSHVTLKTASRAVFQDSTNTDSGYIGFVITQFQISSGDADGINFINNIALQSGSNPTYGGGTNVFFLGNAAVAPGSNPTSGGILYAEAGALKYRGSSGSVTTIANA